MIRANTHNAPPSRSQCLPACQQRAPRCALGRRDLDALLWESEQRAPSFAPGPRVIGFAYSGGADLVGREFASSMKPPRFATVNGASPTFIDRTLGR
jgi:hypothetical protein